MTRLERLRERRAALQAQADRDRGELSDLLLADAMNPDQVRRMGELTEARASNSTALAAVDAQIVEEEAAQQRASDIDRITADAGTAPAAQRRGVGGARIGAEVRTYNPDVERRGRSIFRDAFMAQFRNDVGAQERLNRHSREVVVEGEIPTQRDASRGDIEERATTTGSYAGLVVPQYLVDRYALILRNGRPLANVVNRLPLPEQGMSLIIPRQTTGAAVASQATENSALQSTDQVWQNLTVPVVTVGGQQDISRQSIERGDIAMDMLTFMDLTKAYNAEADRQVAIGSGASGQMLGILSTSGINKNTVYGAAVTPATFALKASGGLAAIASAGTAVTPSVWVMHPRRWYWLLAQSDSAGRPLAVVNMQGPQNALAINALPGGYSGDGGDNAAKIVGWFQGLPVVLDANLPTNLGVGTNEDAMIAMDGTEAFLWEDNGGVPREFRFEQTLGQNLTVKLVLFNYLAFTAGRYPVAFSQVGGVETGGAGAFGQLPPTF